MVANQLFEQALAAWRADRATEAEQGFREILVADPRHVPANIALGIGLVRSGRPSEAIGHLSAVLEQEPDNLEAIKWIASALTRLGRWTEAIAYAEHAAELKPEDYAIRMATASAYFGAGRLEDAARTYELAVKIDPALEHAYFGLERALWQLGFPRQARQALIDASRAVPGVSCALRIAEISMHCGLPDEAVEWATSALAASDQAVPAKMLLAAAYGELGRTAEEEAVLEDLAVRCPADSHVFALRGARLQARGRFVEAEAEFRRSIEIDARQGDAYHGLVVGRRIAETDSPIVEQMERALREGGINSNEEGLLRFALGKAYDDLGRYGEAMAQFVTANRILGMLHTGGRRFDRAALTRETDNTIKLFSAEGNRISFPLPRLSPSPIVIGGMIRSGTTLAEQILSSHPRVGAAGEQPFWRNASKECVDVGPGEDHVTFHPEAIRRARRKYVELLKSRAPGYEFVTDKYPANFKDYGLIHLAFPDSPIIHMRRHPADVAISIFTTMMRTGAEFKWDREDTVFVLTEHARLEEHWCKVIPPERYLVVEYEDLVTEPESVIRRMLCHAGLDWNEACLHPEQNRRSVATPSIWQVRQPINPRSIGRWRRYEPWLGPLAQLLP